LNFLRKFGFRRKEIFELSCLAIDGNSGDLDRPALESSCQGAIINRAPKIGTLQAGAPGDVAAVPHIPIRRAH
jgi:hypothetical protein